MWYEWSASLQRHRLCDITVSLELQNGGFVLDGLCFPCWYWPFSKTVWLAKSRVSRSTETTRYHIRAERLGKQADKSRTWNYVQKCLRHSTTINFDVSCDVSGSRILQTRYPRTLLWSSYNVIKLKSSDFRKRYNSP